MQKKSNRPRSRPCVASSTMLGAMQSRLLDLSAEAMGTQGRRRMPGIQRRSKSYAGQVNADGCKK